MKQALVSIWFWLALGLLLAALAAAASLATAWLGAETLLLGSVTGLVALRWLGVGRILARYAERLILHEATFRAMAALRLRVFTQLAAEATGWQRQGDQLARLLNDVDALDGLVLRVLAPAVAALVAALGLIALSAQPWLALPLGAALLVLAYIMRPVRRAGQQAVAATAALRLSINDALAGLTELAAWQAGPRAAHTVMQATAGLNAAQLQERYGISFGVLALGFTLSLLCLLVLLALSGPLAVMMVVVLGVAAEMLLPLPAAWSAWGRMEAASQRLRPTSAPTPPVALPAPADTTLSVRNVTLAYGGQPPVFTGLTFTLPPGSRLGLVAPSGAGKSSLMALLAGLQAPTSGTVQLGGVNIHELPDIQRAEFIAGVFQEPQILSGTVAANLRLFAPGATDAELMAALTRMGLAERLQLTDWVGENGNLLSGGEARRLELARLMLSPAPIWLLDEPGEWLDAATRTEVLAALAEKSAGKTVLVITHQPEVLAALAAPAREVLASSRIPR